jgi:hypothetical protein
MSAVLRHRDLIGDVCVLQCDHDQTTESPRGAGTVWEARAKAYEDGWLVAPNLDDPRLAYSEQAGDVDICRGCMSQWMILRLAELKREGEWTA